MTTLHDHIAMRIDALRVDGQHDRADFYAEQWQAQEVTDNDAA